MNLCFSLTGENQNVIKRLWRVSIRINLFKNLFFNSKGMFYFVIVKVLYILARILLFMVDLNILMYDIIGSVMFLTLNYWSLRRFIQTTMVQIWWQRLYQRESLKLVGLFMGWHLPSLKSEGEFVVWVLLKLSQTTFYFNIKYWGNPIGFKWKT